MHFTLVFASHEAEDISFSICFNPCLVWVKGKEVVDNPHPENPEYQSGDLKNFLAKSNLEPTSNNVAVIIHPDGHGQQKDLDLLLEDISAIGFKSQTISF